MSGHSHWATIKRQKEASDLQKGKVFSKISRIIMIAAREGSDPETNFKLRLAIEKAKQANMPKDNILRAIKKGSGQEGGESWEEAVFEGYGPGGVGFLVETVTDNRNRTAAQIKNIFERGGGSLAGPGAVSYLFKRFGLISLQKLDKVDEQILTVIDLGAEDVEEESDKVKVFVAPEKLKEFKESLESKGFNILNVELTIKPLNPVKIDNPVLKEAIIKFIENLGNCDDVQKVYANFDIVN